jgi:DNA-binding XRE family transcriptional regulator
LAATAGVSRHTIALSERGYRPSEESRRKIAAALGSTVAELWVESLNDHEPADRELVEKVADDDRQLSV